jgi:GTP-binding protein
LIEGAHAGVGLGHDFLRHIERTRILVHVVDAAGTEGRDPFEDVRKINEELRLYQPELAQRPQILALNKIDIPEAQDRLPKLRRRLGVSRDMIFPISAATGEGIPALLQRVAEMLREQPDTGLMEARRERSDEVVTWPVPVRDPNAFTVTREGQGFRVRGAKIEHTVSMLNFAQQESLDRLQRVLDRSGISDALRDAGVQEGDPVYIEKAELEWSEELSR